MQLETQRILDLTVKTTTPVDMTERFRRPGGTQTLYPLQSRALYEGEQAGGLLAAIGVGLGKTLIAFLLAAAMSAERALLLIPSSVFAQCMRMRAEYQLHWILPPLKVLPYSLLQVKRYASYLYEYGPDLIIADEAHRLKSWDSARTGRVVDYFRDNPDTMFAGLSGTMTSNSLRDYAHLAELALREGSPLPRERGLLNLWQEVLDADAKDPSETALGALTGVCQWAGMDDPRKAFAERLTQTWGVVTSSEKVVKASLRMIEISDLDLPQAYFDTQHVDHDPSGEPFDTPANKGVCLRYLSLGFYHIWEWEGAPDDEYTRARRAWAKAAFYELRGRRQRDYDSKALVYDAVEANPHHHLRGVWEDWVAVRDRPGHITTPVWLDKSIVEKAVDRVKGRKIIWYRSQAVRDRLIELGIPTVSAGDPLPDNLGEDTLAMSIESHLEGLNLQMYNRNLVLEPPSGGGIWEQLIGRTHRLGQEEDEVLVYYLAHSDVFARAMVKAKKDAEYQETTRVRRRLCYADWC